MATGERFAVTVDGCRYFYPSQAQRDRALCLAAARQQLAHEGVRWLPMPTWEQLSEREREDAILDASHWLSAATRAGLLDDDVPALRAEIEQLRAEATAAQFGEGLASAVGRMPELRQAVGALVLIAGLTGHTVEDWPRALSVADAAAHAVNGVRALRDRYRTAAREVGSRG
ncbi:hypothetical protein NLX83_39695 [Allokutzneria sp. A3M-2-11 16]|uniref:hypothetical protein n=1 Tax=Allokutzneria sp. A3M-2-11 16 TaxID=2962043 RepID=UPI0020B79A68|nr:hypothetical protein [Allokutzneria sp. A3M-2-11 16]MCP3805409.1 hypothetical protein [Allokutzneria sp. A3M-2-11 16]